MGKLKKRTKKFAPKIKDVIKRRRKAQKIKQRILQKRKHSEETIDSEEVSEKSNFLSLTTFFFQFKSLCLRIQN
jgi:hypothetical protein